MSSEALLLVAAGAVVLVVLVGAVLTVRSAARARAELAHALEAAQAEVGALAARVAALEQVTASPARPDTAPVVEGRVPDSDPAGLADQQPTVTIDGRIDGRLFADLVARESTIRAAGLVHGLRRALSPETRNRIGFEVRQEVKRSRRQRRADLRAALREQQARERRGMPEGADDWDAA